MTIQVLVRLILYIDQYVDNKLAFECYTLQRMVSCLPPHVLCFACQYIIFSFPRNVQHCWFVIEASE